jgi:hypothetical protein
MVFAMLSKLRIYIFKYSFIVVMLLIMISRSYSQPVASFTSNNLCYGNTSNFHSTSTINGTLDSMIWIVTMGGTKDTFRGKKIDTLNYSFLFPGTFQVSLKVKTSTGTSVSTQSITIQSIAYVSFTINNNTQPLTNNLFNFTPNVIVNPSGTATYVWKFGDGQTLSGANPSYVYSSAGIFSVWLIAKTSNGCIDSIDDNVFVINDVKDVVVNSTVFFINKNTTTYINMNLTLDTGNFKNNGQAYLTSNITSNNNSRISGTGKYKLIGNPSNIITTLPGDTFSFVEINKSSPNARVEILNNTNFANLEFKSNNLVYADNDTLYIVNSTDTSISGYNSSRYIVGYLSRKVVSSKSYNYPVGTNSEYHHVVIDIDTLNNINYITGKYYPGTKQNRLLDVKNEGPYDSLNPKGTWQFWPTYTTAGTSSIIYDMSLSLNQFAGLTDNAFAILKKKPTDPDKAFQTGGGVLPAKNAFGRKVSDGYAKRTGFTSFSEFGIGMSKYEIRPGIVLCLKAMLEGPYSAVQMKMDTNYLFQDTLKRYHSKQPYNKAPWNYAGVDSFTKNSLPSPTIIDWMLISLRSTPAASSAFDTIAVLIRNDGYLVNTKAADSIVMMQATNLDSFYIVLQHRNHLAVMTVSKAGKQFGVYNYDFTTSAKKGYSQGSAPLKNMGSGVFAMWAGNATGDGNVNAADYTQWRINNGLLKYNGADLNLELNINSADYSKWRLNNGRSTQVP